MTDLDIGLRQSHLFTKTRKEAPADEAAKNAQLLIRAGYVHKEMAGVYGYLPLGIRVLEKIKRIIREELKPLGCMELLMTTLQRKELWESTDRWDSEKVDVWFKAHLAAGGEVGFGWSHEEPIGNMLRDHIASYRDLPLCVYQFQMKLRNELRAKSGVLRGREFLMKDAYSFCADEVEHERLYEGMKDAYLRVFRRVGIGDDTFVTFASGGAFTEFSHEFQTICDAGEDTCYVNRGKGIAINEEVANEMTFRSLGVTREELALVRTAEVGNIFNFGRRKAEQLGLTFADTSGVMVPVWMGSYGIGVTRLMAVVVETCADEQGIVWPEAVAPFAIHLVRLGKDEQVVKAADDLFALCLRHGVEVLYDDRDLRAGEKFADSDLIGIPNRVVVSDKTVHTETYETIDRASKEVSMLSRDALMHKLVKNAA